MLNIVLLSVTNKPSMLCHYAEYSSDECHLAERHYTECRYAECCCVIFRLKKSLEFDVTESGESSSLYCIAECGLGLGPMLQNFYGHNLQFFVIS